MNQNELELESRRCRIHQELKQLAGNYRFMKMKKNYYIAYHPEANIIACYSTYAFHPNVVYFPTEELANKAIEAIGYDRLLSDYFNYDY